MTCHLCEEPAVSRLVFRRSDGTEAGRTQPKCRRHYHEALDLWDNFREVVPEAVGDLTVLVSAYGMADGEHRKEPRP